MKDKNKTKAQLLEELENLRQHVAELESYQGKGSSELQESEEKYSTLVQMLGEGVVLAQDGEIVFANQMFCEMLEIEKSDWEGKNLLDILSGKISFVLSSMSEKEKELVIGNITEGMRGETKLHTYQVPFMKMSGDRLWAEVTASSIEYRGRPAELAIIRDITERKQVEGTLRMATTILDTMIDGVTVTDMQGRIIDINDATTRQIGYTRKEALGQTPADLFVAENDQLKFYEELTQLFSGKSIPDAEYLLRHKDGSKFSASINISVMRNHDGEPSGVVAVHRDITELKQAKEQMESLVASLEGTNRKLEQSNKDLQDFTYVASHDLREPIRKVSAFGAVLADSLKGKLDEDDQENLDFMVDGARRMQQMVDALLTYSRVTTKAKVFSKVNLNKVIDDLRKLEISSQIEDSKGIIELPEPLPVVVADEIQMHQLLQNLIGNSLKYHDKNVIPKTIVRSYPWENNMVRIEVQDNGIGIGADHLEEVFNMFTRLHTRSEYEGTGIGLSVCKKIVERHGGDIGVESTPGDGSTFWFTVPREDSETQHEAVS